jgi:hypothetical protein
LQVRRDLKRARLVIIRSEATKQSSGHLFGSLGLSDGAFAAWIILAGRRAVSFRSGG